MLAMDDYNYIFLLNFEFLELPKCISYDVDLNNKEIDSSNNENQSF